MRHKSRKQLTRYTGKAAPETRSKPQHKRPDDSGKYRYKGETE